MNIRQMRKIDTYVGGITCLLLEIYERIIRLFVVKKTNIPQIERILITKYLGMGSILLTTPMLRALRTKFPRCKIVFLTFGGNAKFTKQISLIDEVVSIRTESLFLFMSDLLRVLIKIRRERFDVVFDLEFFARFSTIVSYLSGTKIRLGYFLPKLWRGDLLTHQIHFNPYKHVTEVFAAQLKPLGINVTDFSLIPPIVKEDNVKNVYSLLKENGLREEGRLVSINVNASDLSKERRWPKDGFIELIGSIVGSNQGVRIVLVGSKGETEYVREVLDALPDRIKGNIVNLAGRLDIEELIALLRQSTLFVTNDSGPLHVASALGTPTVSFFGPESPSLYGPVGNNNIVFYAGIYCSPCLNVYNAKTAMCKGYNICMKEIKSSEVIKVLASEGII